MRKAKAFFYVCAGVFLLALSWHLGAQSARAQAGNAVAGFSVSQGDVDLGSAWAKVFVMTSNGDVFARSMGGGTVVPLGNFWAKPFPTQKKSWGQFQGR